MLLKWVIGILVSIAAAALYRGILWIVCHIAFNDAEERYAATDSWADVSNSIAGLFNLDVFYYNARATPATVVIRKYMSFLAFFVGLSCVFTMNCNIDTQPIVYCILAALFCVAASMILLIIYFIQERVVDADEDVMSLTAFVLSIIVNVAFIIFYIAFFIEYFHKG